MIKQDVWLDKLPEDKAKYYNRTRMSMDFFAQKLGIAPQLILEDFNRNGYIFIEEERKVILDDTKGYRPKYKAKTSGATES